MLRDFTLRARDLIVEIRHVRKYDPYLLGLNGVIHIGANSGQERAYYQAAGLEVLWVEPIPDVFEKLVSNIHRYPRQRALSYLLSDVDGKTYELNIANNDAQSSSIFDLSLHAELWPEVQYVDRISLRSTRFDTMVDTEHIDLDRYEALILDTQGAELLILQGAGDLLSNFRFIKTEAADFEIYAGGAHLGDLIKHLAGFGFSELGRWKFADGPPEGSGCYDVIFERR